MNQEQNNFNNQNINNGTINNQPLPNSQNLNNQFNQNSNVNQPTFNQQAQLTPQPMNIFESGNANNQNSNSKTPKKLNIGLIIGIIVAILILAVIVILILNNNNKSNTSNNDSNKQFAEDVIMNHATINNIKLSEINTINDVMEKLNAEINWVMVCYKETESEEGCPNYSLTEFESNNVEKKGISTLTFNFKIKNSDKIFDFSTFYKTYKEKGYNAPYYSLEFRSNNLILLNNEYVENISMDTIKSKYKLSSTSDYWYYIDFESLDGDKYRYIGYPNNQLVEIFNYTERDRGL